MPVIYVKLRAIFQPNGSCIDFFLLKWDQYFIFGFLCLIKPDSDRITTFEHFISQKNGVLSRSAILEFQATHQFETYINEFLKPKSPYSDPDHAFLSSIEAEIIPFLPKRAAILCFLAFKAVL